MRCFGVFCTFALLATSAAAAQIPEVKPSSASAEASCPRGRLSIYYASGEAEASPQAEALIGLIGEHASSCNPDGLDLIARIDARVDGEQAIGVALQRLSAVAADLVSQGVPVDRIRVAAQADRTPDAPNLNQVDVIFRKADVTEAGNVAAPAAPPVRTASSDAI